MHFSLLQKICQGRSFLLSVDGPASLFADMSKPPYDPGRRSPYRDAWGENAAIFLDLGLNDRKNAHPPFKT
jgi:hypothetical protein